ncbi:MAG: helix-turn-helix domain-containing protein [Ruminococcus sp.]|nr:helix-turn-helix domain-containing protein [Ruminococcus sp.]
MEHIYYETPAESMIVVCEESVKLIKEKARERNLTTNRLIIKSGLDKSIIEGLYYGRHRIRLAHLHKICEVVFGSTSACILNNISNEGITG